MGIIDRLTKKRAEKKMLLDQDCNYVLKITEQSILNMQSALSSNIYIDPETVFHIHSDLENVSDIIKKTGHKLRKAKGYDELCKNEQKANSLYKSFVEEKEKHNSLFVKEAIPHAYDLIGKVEGMLLDEQQMGCIVKPVHNHLVVAGAGSGKTTTILGKVKHLLLLGIEPKNILVLSFTNASASEMRARIDAETGGGVEVFTFHKLGLNILSQSEGVMPKIVSESTKNFVDEWLKSKSNNRTYVALLARYLLSLNVKTEYESDFKTKEEYEEHLKTNPPTTMMDEKVKSYGEVEISNYLAMNGIRYIYENPYEIDTRTADRRQYAPDFYLPDYGIYIEYFGIDRNGRVPSFFQGSGDKDPSTEYQESMGWKRNIHKTNGTVLIECYAYELWEGNLIDNLETKLKAFNVTHNPMNADELMNIIRKNGCVMSEISEAMANLIDRIKNTGYSFDEARRIVESKHHFRSKLLFSLLKPIFEDYQSKLIEREEIDFNDMINKAITAVESGSYQNHYDYVIVDEYQDISRSRYKLLKSLRHSKDYNLFCVGDDWQSIYRFAGSDVSFMLEFTKWWGPCETSRIEKTYRFNAPLTDISSAFVMKNPSQIKKKVISDLPNPSEIEIIKCSHDGDISRKIYEASLHLPQNSKVFLIGRYNSDIKLLSESTCFEYNFDISSWAVNVKHRERHDLKISFITAHKSKGLQADYVFIINNKKGRYGFPGDGIDDNVADALLEDEENYPYSEERRLYYVAMTRAKKKTFIVTIAKNKSIFVDEITSEIEKIRKANVPCCPRCGAKLVLRKGPYSQFYGCSNYYHTGCDYKRKA